jgi:signal peptidase I
VKRFFFASFCVVGAIIVMIIIAMFLMTIRAIPYEIRIVTTGSMRPTISPYSAILIRRGRYEVGQPISFQTPNGIVTHRLIAVNADGSLATKGDAVATIDPMFEPASKVIGGVKLIIRSGPFWFLDLIFLAVLLYALSCLADTGKIKETAS